mmetsp:Transcript_35750/g.54988  ORF Transcript_35750/g.54988 Transcript_35750/m.54988 type:complete len:196 (-) Transcript_35750:124-711(-)
MSLQEYQAQLEEVENLILADPNDTSLQDLKNDLLELIQLTKGTQQEKSGTEVTDSQPTNDAVDDAQPGQYKNHVAGNESEGAVKKEMKADTTASSKPSVSKEFEVPTHLVPLDTDSSAEQTRKRRAIKALKGKWKLQKKERVAAKKQQTWQSFVKKKKVVKSKSIFATEEGVQARVGVIGRGNTTENAPRKRHTK